MTTIKHTVSFLTLIGVFMLNMYKNTTRKKLYNNLIFNNIYTYEIGFACGLYV